MTSRKPAPLELERGVVTTPADVAALRRRPARSQLTPEEYLRFLQQFEYSVASLRARGITQGEPFRLAPVESRLP